MGFRKFILLFVAVTFVALPTTYLSASEAGGAGDGGGGSEPLSTLEEVKTKFEEVRLKFADEKYLQRVLIDLLNLMPKPTIRESTEETKQLDKELRELVALRMKKGDAANEEILNRAKKIYPKKTEELIRSIESVALVYLFLEQYQKDPVRFFAREERFIIFNEKPCKNLFAEERVASVTAFNYSGKICISFYELREIHPESLFPTIFNYILHETLHLAGERSEEKVQYISELFVRNSSYLLKSFPHEFTRDLSNQIMSISRTLWELNVTTTLNSRIQFYGVLSQVKGQIWSLLNFIPTEGTTDAVPTLFSSGLLSDLKSHFESQYNKIDTYLNYVEQGGKLNLELVNEIQADFSTLPPELRSKFSHPLIKHGNLLKSEEEIKNINRLREDTQQRRGRRMSPQLPPPPKPSDDF